MVCEVKALACQLPVELGLPLSRFSRTDLQREVLKRGLTASISGSTIWRWLHADAIRPWTRRSWFFPRDPSFSEKAGRVLDLYHGMWEGAPLSGADFVLSADEKTQLQIRRRLHLSQPPGPRQPLRFEHEYERGGTCAYLAAWDVRHARLFGTVVEHSTNAAFDAFVEEVMDQPPYRQAERVFWIVDNGTTHRGERARQRLQCRWSNLVLVHLPVHASWLNQIEIYFSVLARKALTPDDFHCYSALQNRVMDFQAYYEQIAAPFEWKFTRQDLHRLLARCPAPPEALSRAA